MKQNTFMSLQIFLKGKFINSDEEFNMPYFGKMKNRTNQF